MRDKEKQKAYNARYYAKHKAKACRVAKEYYAARKAQIPSSRQRVAKWRAENPERNRRHRDKGNAKQRKDHKKRARQVSVRRKSDTLFWLKGVLRGRISVALKKSGVRKSSKTCDLIGCDVQALRAHLESLFLHGMTWENRRLWHIDHIKPCARFNLLDPAEQRLCFHFTNLQPLWVIDNLTKGAKLSPIHKPLR